MKSPSKKTVVKSHEKPLLYFEFIIIDISPFLVCIYIYISLFIYLFIYSFIYLIYLLIYSFNITIDHSIIPSNGKMWYIIIVIDISHLIYWYITIHSDIVIYRDTIVMIQWWYYIDTMFFNILILWWWYYGGWKKSCTSW